MDALVTLAVIAVIVVLIFDYTNGFHDASNIVATVIASHAMTPIQAVLLVATFEFLGPLLGGTAVANTIGSFIDVSGMASRLISDHCHGRRQRCHRLESCDMVGWHSVQFVTCIGWRSDRPGPDFGGPVECGLGVWRADLSRPRNRCHKGSVGADPVADHWVLGRLHALQRIAGFFLRGARPSLNRNLRRGQIATAAGWPFRTVPTMPRKAWASSHWCWCRAA